MKKALGLFFALFLVACSSSGAAGSSSPSQAVSGAPPTPSAGSTPAPTTASLGCPAVQPAPEFAPAIATNRDLALVGLNGNQVVAIQDVTDPLHPTTVSTLDNVHMPMKFVSGSEISFADSGAGGSGDLMRLPLSGSPWTTVAKLCNGGGDFAWSPDGTGAAYLTSSKVDPVTHDYAWQIRLIQAGQDRLIGTAPPSPSVACSQAICDLNHLDLLYSPDGAYISLVTAWTAPTLRVWTSSGKLLASLDSQLTTWSVWSGDTLYFRTDAGVETWRDGTRSLVLPGVAWIEPHASPAGGLIVYVVRDGSGLGHVELLDTATSRTRELQASRTAPEFFTSRFIWYQGEDLCPPNSGCTGNPPYTWQTYFTGETYIYDLQTGAETASGITSVYDVWPHPA